MNGAVATLDGGVTNGAAVVDLSREFGPDAKGIAYAAAETYVNRDMNATIRVESSEKADCWINGQAVTLVQVEKDVDRAYGSQIRLRLGYNKVVIGLRGLRHGRGKWSFSTRVLDEAGEPIDRKRLRILDDGVGFVPAEVPLEIRGGSDILLELHRP
ncbi:MAG: hypothetical protein QGD90_07170, partial [Candidatus Hydrogenedentes bacterium]|nr:hypothetical protein [Candidatus Hydrogenedentota bacterium]